MLGYNFVQEFLNNIFYSRGKTFDTKATSVWMREIINTNADINAMYEAEKEIMNDETIELKIPTIKKIIENHKNQNKAIPFKLYCDLCKGTGLITITAFFNKDGKYIPSQDFALGCNCVNGENKNLVKINGSARNFKTEVKDGYILSFNNIRDRQSYLDRVLKNNGKDFLK